MHLAKQTNKISKIMFVVEFSLDKGKDYGHSLCNPKLGKNQKKTSCVPLNENLPTRGKCFSLECTGIGCRAQEKGHGFCPHASIRAHKYIQQT